MEEKKDSNLTSLPVLPVRDRVVYPSLNVPLVIGRPRSIQALNLAQQKDHLVFVVTQRNMRMEEPSREDLYEFGTIAEILSSTQLPDGFVRIRVLGQKRAKLLDLSFRDGSLMGDVSVLASPTIEKEQTIELEALKRLLLKKFEEYVRKSNRLSPDVLEKMNEIYSLDHLSDAVAEALLISLQEKQELLELVQIQKRLSRLVEILDAEIEILQIERKIQNRVHRQIEKSQKEYYLNEQMRAIQRELKKKDDFSEEMEELRGKIKKLKMPEKVEEMALKEVIRLEKMMPYSPEATVVRGYLDVLLSLPWAKTTKDKIDVEEAKRIMEKDHYGLEKPKERILEYMAVLKLTQKIKGPILCFIGPPGTGKTSLVKSMAKAMGRKFLRISLGGVRDEAEVRGHRRTYIGSMPGRIIQGLKKAETRNPIVLLDEIDKMGSDWRGDPSAALLEVLDPEQNYAFIDHFLDVEFDLSQVIFIATGNSIYEIPKTLLDRLEVIRFSAYTTDEKVAIAKQFILSKELKEHGLPEKALQFEDEAIRKIIHLYTQEAGVRELQRKIAKICRKVAVDWVKSKGGSARPKTKMVRLKDLSQYLGVAEYVKEKLPPNAVGVATGLAWTENGGETLSIEVSPVPGTGKIIMTGKLGSVMQESAQAAYSLVKSRAKKLKIKEQDFRKHDLHVHIPEGAVPKDGPSAGIVLTTAIVSALSGIPVRKEIGMTGEVTLRGRVLAIGGLKEKVLAAFRDELKVVLYPKANEKDLPDIPEKVRKNLKLIPVESIDDVLKLALQPAPLRSASVRSSSSQRKSASLPRHN